MGIFFLGQALGHFLHVPLSDVSGGHCGCLSVHHALLHVATVPLGLHQGGPGPNHAGGACPGGHLPPADPVGAGYGIEVFGNKVRNCAVSAFWVCVRAVRS